MNAPAPMLSTKDDQLWVESVRLADVARSFGTPCYVYSRAALEAALTEFTAGLSGVDGEV